MKAAKNSGNGTVFRQESSGALVSFHGAQINADVCAKMI